MTAISAQALRCHPELAALVTRHLRPGETLLPIVSRAQPRPRKPNRHTVFTSDGERDAYGFGYMDGYQLQPTRRTQFMGLERRAYQAGRHAGQAMVRRDGGSR